MLNQELIQQKLSEEFSKLAYYLTEMIKELINIGNIDNFNYGDMYYFFYYLLIFGSSLIFSLIVISFMKFIIIKFKNFLSKRIKTTCLLINWEKQRISKVNLNKIDYEFLQRLYKKSPITVIKLSELPFTL